MDFAALAQPFPESDIEWRIAQSGRTRNGDIWAKVLAYVTNRAIMERLDIVAGPDRWKNEFCLVNGGVMCGLSIYTAGSWITKWDGSENTDFEPFKGGISGAMKRAAVHWGIGRYLYNLGESWATCTQERTPGAHHAKTKMRSNAGGEEMVEFFWSPPGLPTWALPRQEQKPSNPPSPPAPPTPKEAFNVWIKPFMDEGVITRDNVLAVLSANNNDYEAAQKEIQGQLDLLGK